DSIHRPIKSIDDYIVEKENGEKRLEEITAAMQRQQTEREELQEQLKRKYQPQIKEQKAIISQIEYELEQLERQYQQDMLDLEEWKKKANEERNAKINRLENEQRKRVAELDGINSKLKNLNKEKTEKLDSLKLEWNKQQQALAAEKRTQAEVIGKEEKEEQRRISSIKTEYEADMQKELHSQGADTERLQDIANQLAQLEKELSFIKENATLVIEYQKDKRDLIDRIPGWQREHDEQKRLLQLERETLRVETSSLQEKIDLLNKEWEEAEENVRELQKNLEAYSKIPAYDWYKPHQDIFRSENTQTMQTTKTCMELIDELTRQANQFTQVQSKLRKEVNLFTGHFDEDNTFKFRVKFNEDWEYVRFADELHDFVEEHRIDEYIRRINNEHWDTFKRISMDTSMLTSSEDDIQDVIREINKGFATCNFVGVIQRIEMKVEESSNRVVNILREIQKYYHDYGYDLSPETNLFSSAKEQLVKEEAITLLRTFIKEIHAYRYDSIRLYDSFELRFRIVENGNDTGFIEKIANVGSEGTDILVKAMINIMLLNVFKEGASRKFKDFKLHCMMDEIGKLHPNNISGILKFANDRNIILINGSPTELNRDAYKHVYLLTKGTQNKTRIARLISDKQL
ncbi:MAG TPA: ATP-binding protein, partial [Bacteroides sp.]|nr:ATP-binding protein [Bacteroides sp.]